MRRTLALVMAVGALVIGGIATPAEAGNDRVKPTAHVVSVSKVYRVEGQPMVAGTYRCTGRLSHLWVSVKQGKGDLTQEGSGADARAWYQRTWDNVVKCDGKRHTKLFRMDPTGDTGRLRTDRHAYVQFCLLTANSRNGFGEGGNAAFDSNMKYRRVRAFSTTPAV